MDIFQYFRETSNLLLPSCRPANRCYSPSNTTWFGYFWPKMAPSDPLVQRILWKNTKNGIFEALFQQVNDIVQMRDMAHSICLIKLYQMTMRKKFRFFVSDDYLNVSQLPKLSHFSLQNASLTILCAVTALLQCFPSTRSSIEHFVGRATGLH